jgi:hypothetical protein
VTAPHDPGGADTEPAGGSAGPGAARASDAVEEAGTAGIDLHSLIDALGWHQGAILPANTIVIEAVQMVPFAKFDKLPNLPFWLVLVSQDCDVVCHSIDVEPAVELLVALPIERELEPYRQVRHPRELHLTLEGDGGARQPVSLHIRNRALLDRRLLVSHRPSTEMRIASHLVDQISSFLGGRYTRAAYPGTFENRFRRAKRALIGVFEKYVNELQDIFLVVRPFEEVDESEPYTLTVYAVVRDHVADGPANSYNTLKQEIAAAIRKPLRLCDGIELEKVNVCGRDEISLREFGRMMPLDYAAAG